MLIWLPYLNPTSEPIEVLFQDCLIEGTGMVIGRANVGGRIIVDRVTIQNTDLGAIDLVDKSIHTRVEFSNLTLRETARLDLEGLTPIMLYGQNPNIEHGNIRLNNVFVQDNGNRAVMSAWEYVWSPGGLHDTLGTVFVEDPEGTWADLNIRYDVNLDISHGTPSPPVPPTPTEIVPAALQSQTLELTCSGLTPRALNRVQKANPPFESPWQDHSFFITNTPEQTIHIPLEEDEVQTRFRILSR